MLISSESADDVTPAPLCQRLTEEWGQRNPRSQFYRNYYSCQCQKETLALGQFTMGNHSTLLETVHNAILRDILVKLLYHLYLPPALAKQIASFTTFETHQKFFFWDDFKNRFYSSFLEGFLDHFNVQWKVSSLFSRCGLHRDKVSTVTVSTAVHSLLLSQPELVKTHHQRLIIFSFSFLWFCL